MLALCVCVVRRGVCGCAQCVLAGHWFRLLSAEEAEFGTLHRCVYLTTHTQANTPQVGETR